LFEKPKLILAWSVSSLVIEKWIIEEKSDLENPEKLSENVTSIFFGVPPILSDFVSCFFFVRTVIKRHENLF